MPQRQYPPGTPEAEREAPRGEGRPRTRTYRQPSAAPTAKVTAAGAGGAAATIIVWLIQLFSGADVPPGIEGAIATFAAAVLGYMVPERRTAR